MFIIRFFWSLITFPLRLSLSAVTHIVIGSVQLLIIGLFCVSLIYLNGDGFYAYAEQQVNTHRKTVERQIEGFGNSLLTTASYFLDQETFGKVNDSSI